MARRLYDWQRNKIISLDFVPNYNSLVVGIRPENRGDLSSEAIYETSTEYRHIAREHVRFYLGEDGDVYVQDCGSKNGTAVYRDDNSLDISRMTKGRPLDSGDSIVLAPNSGRPYTFGYLE